MAAADASSLLTVDVDQVAVAVEKDVLASAKAAVEALPDDKLMAEVSAVEAELAKALAALAKKGGSSAAASSSSGPIAFFEGAPIDCGKVAAVAIDSYFEHVSDDELKKLIASTEASLAKAKACLEKKLAAPATPSKAAAAAVSTDSPSSASPMMARMGESAKKLVGAVDDGLKTAEAKTGVPKETLAATLIAGAVAVGASILGAFAKKGR